MRRKVDQEKASGIRRNCKLHLPAGEKKCKDARMNKKGKRRKKKKKKKKKKRMKKEKKKREKATVAAAMYPRIVE